jgi:hypothetical protein
VRTFLVAHPHLHLHFTPTYSSWLNQVELTPFLPRDPRLVRIVEPLLLRPDDVVCCQHVQHSNVLRDV